MDKQFKILVIDDEKVVLDSCTAILANSNYELATASDGILGLELIREYQPDLVFVDLKMPGISGMEVVKKINEYDPTITTIVITGFATVSSAVEAMKNGAYDFLPKPFTPDEFRLITKRGLEKRKLLLETISLRNEKAMLSENFAAIVSHELKSPLGAVQQNLFVLEHELSNSLNEDQQARLGKMKKRIQELIEIIHSWLRIISVDIEVIKDQFQPVVVQAVVAKAVENLEPHAIRKDIHLMAESEEPSATTLGDEVTLTEVLVNLGTNAIKYSYSGGTIRFNTSIENDNIKISVKDTGVGIPEADQIYIFEDFFTKRLGHMEERGHGLGLALSRRIVDAHDGKISVTSKPGIGSEFVIKLPIYTPEKPEQSLSDTDPVKYP